MKIGARLRNLFSLRNYLSGQDLVRTEFRLNRIRVILFGGIFCYELFYWIGRHGLEGFLAEPVFPILLVVLLFLPLRVVFYLTVYRRVAERRWATRILLLFIFLDHAAWTLLALQGWGDLVRLVVLYLFLYPYTGTTQMTMNTGISIFSGVCGSFAFVVLLVFKLAWGQLPGDSGWIVFYAMLTGMLSVNGLIAAMLNNSNRARYLRVRGYQAMLLRQRNELIRNQNFLPGFYARVSHELRTPLHGILGMAGLLQETRPDSEQTEYVHSIRASAEALLSLINNILDKSKIDAGYFVPESRPFSLKDTLELVTANIRHSLGPRPVRLEVQLDPDLPLRVVGDQARLMQILFNLLGNAVKFTPAGTVALRVYAEPAEAGEAGGDSRKFFAFEVRDTGIGISPENLHMIFEEFRQVEPSGYGQGTGLGLSITRELVQRMGGDIRVWSEFGQGSEFRFRLPLEIQVSGQVDDLPLFSGSRPSAPDCRRVLIVDDNSMNLRILERMVLKAQGSPVLADSGESCLRRLGENRFDLVLLDYEMPGQDGLEVISRIRQEESRSRRNPVRIVLITGHGREYFQGLGIPANVSVFQKPIRLHQIQDLIHTQDAGCTDAG